MKLKDKKAIRNIILINPMICGLQDIIEREQESVIADMETPAAKIVGKLIALDNRRIDLCNLKVLYGFIERGLGEKFELLRACVFGGFDCGLFELAAKQLELAGYTATRVGEEFEYLFKTLKGGKRAKKISGAAADGICGNAFSGGVGA